MIRVALVVLAVALAACTRSRAATRYEVWSWSIAIPNDLGVRPSNDSGDIWKNGPLMIIGADGSARLLGVRVQPLEERTSTADTALELLREVAAGAETEEVGPVTPRRFPVGDGAVVHAVRLGLDLDIAYIVARGQLITVTASEMTPADVLFVADSFAFRDPPGNPLSPPPSGPRTSASASA